MTRARAPRQVYDVNGQQLDTRRENSWLLKLGEVATGAADSRGARGPVGPLGTASRTPRTLSRWEKSPRKRSRTSARTFGWTARPGAAHGVIASRCSTAARMCAGCRRTRFRRSRALAALWLSWKVKLTGLTRNLQIGPAFYLKIRIRALELAQILGQPCEL